MKKMIMVAFAALMVTASISASNGDEKKKSKQCTDKTQKCTQNPKCVKPCDQKTAEVKSCCKKGAKA